MKKHVVYPVRVVSHNGERIVTRNTQTHVWRIGKYTPRKAGK